jgi:hypothetical protein
MTLSGFSAVLACAVCAAPAPASDATSTSDDVTMEGSAEVRVGGLTIGRGEDARRILERRLEARLGVRPIPEIVLSVGVPVLVRSFDLEGDESSSVVPGDVEILGNATLVDGGTVIHHHLSLAPIVKLPTAPVEVDAEGVPLESNLQPGCSSIVPIVSALYAFGQPIWTVRFGGGVNLPFPVRDAPHRGALGSLVAEVELRPVPALALRTGSKWLVEATGADAEDEAEEDSGGVTGYLSAGVDIRWEDHLSVGIGVDVPVLKALRGDQDPTPIASLRFGGQWDLTSPSAPPVQMARAVGYDASL